MSRLVKSNKKPLVSVVLISFNMRRELPRVLSTLSVPYQQDIAPGDLEIIVVDNGSGSSAIPAKLPAEATLVRVDRPSHSPARAVNVGLRRARADLIGVMIDGARLASPGLCGQALSASLLSERPIIASLGFHLGPDLQARSVRRGYDRQEEDRLLASVDWRSNGYRLFEISVFAGSSRDGWHAPISESNALFMPRRLWDELGGYDEQFGSPGGGLVNLDAYARACELPDTNLIILLGEGTFHQVHGGITTNDGNAESSHAAFLREYRRIRRKDFAVPRKKAVYFGPSVHASEWVREHCTRRSAILPRRSPSAFGRLWRRVRT